VRDAAVRLSGARWSSWWPRRSNIRTRSSCSSTRAHAESHALDRRSLHAILARLAGHIELFERLLVGAARAGAIAPVEPRLAANIVTRRCPR